jgi:hypothetical protein
MICAYKSFLSFFHSLLSTGIIPFSEFQVVIHYDGNIAGKHIHINDIAFHDPIFDYLRDAKKVKILFTALMFEYTCLWEAEEWSIQQWSRILY